MKLSTIFTDNAVLQAGKPIRIFGTGTGRARITLGDRCIEVNSSEENWCAELDAMNYGGPYALKFSSDEEEKVLTGIYIGEVFLCSGQSNMAFRLKESNTDKSYYENEVPLLRHIEIADDKPSAVWECADPSLVSDWSALGYMVGKECSVARGVAVGIILCAKGASVIESWMPKGALQRIGIDLKPSEKFLDHYHPEYGAWNPDAFLYEGWLRRIIPYTIGAVIWYQGESDASAEEGSVYCQELAELIRIWRDDFCDPALPFVIVQIADTAVRLALGDGWRLVQKAQLDIQDKVAGVYTVISRDISETDDIHPKSKFPLAVRIADVITSKII